MKKYKDHLTSRKSFGELQNNLKKPVFKGSAAFPCIVNNEINTNILYMGYWLAKNNIDKVTIVYTLREIDGTTLDISTQLVDFEKSKNIDVKKLLQKINYNGDEFYGSIELEVISIVDLVFPYPAFVLNYSSDKFSSMVHSSARIYNDIEDTIENNHITVPETGFDIIHSEGFLPFVSFVNGPFEIENEKITLEFTNANNEKFSKIITLENINKYQSVRIILIDEKEKQFFNNDKGSVSITHNLKGFFPRFLVGNINENENILSLTHTYYNTNDHNDDDSYWNNPDKEKYYDSVISLPFFFKDGAYSEIAIYPIFAKCECVFDFELYDSNGNMVYEYQNIHTIENNNQILKYINFNKYVPNEILNDDEQYFIKIIFKSEKIPARMKFGYNFGKISGIDVPSNVCFNAVVCNDKLINKNGTFKWSPIVNLHKSYMVIANFNFLKQKFKEANCVIKVYKETSDETYEFNVTIPNNGCKTFIAQEIPEIKKFMGDEKCWFTVKSDNPFISSWYFEEMPNGFIGGDHSF